MPRAPRSAALLLIASLALAGCSGAAVSSSTEASAPDVAPASGMSIAGTGYSFSAPEGWDVPADEMSAPGLDVFAADLMDADGFADNVNVVLSPAGVVTPDVVETQGVDELEDAGAKDVAVRDRLTVAGSESSHLSAAFSSAGSEYRIEQFYLTGDGQTVVVTFSFSPSVTETERDDLAQSVLASWTWG